jgi:NACHT domain
MPERVPLRVRSGGGFTQTAFQLPQSEEQLTGLIDGRGNRVLIIGQAGQGKSLLAQAIITDYRERHPRWMVAMLTQGQRRAGPLEDQIFRQFSIDEIPSTTSLSPNESALIVLDGLDEIARSERNEILKSIDGWVAAGATSVVTARDRAILSEPYAELYAPMTYTLEPLQQSQILAVAASFAGRAENGDRLVSAVEASLADPSMWAPSPTRRALANPFFLARSCRFFLSNGHIPTSKHEVLKFIIEEALETFGPSDAELARAVLGDIAWYASQRTDGASIVSLSDEDVRRAMTKGISAGYHHSSPDVVVNDLLQKRLLIRVGDHIQFGVHGLLYSYTLAERLLATTETSDLQTLLGLERTVLELLASMLPESIGIEYSEMCLAPIDAAIPPDDAARWRRHEVLREAAPAFQFVGALSNPSVRVVDVMVETGARLFCSDDGVLRWTGVELLSLLGQHLRGSREFVNLLCCDEPGIVADAAEVVVWVAQQQHSWRDWAREEMERICRYHRGHLDPHPLYHVVEGLARLELAHEPACDALLRRLTLHDDAVVSFSAASMLADSERVWMQRGHQLVEWIRDARKLNMKDHVICHGYYPLRWLDHPKFGRHPRFPDACEHVMAKTLELCGALSDTVPTCSSGLTGAARSSIPYYWSWYLAAPIADLHLLTGCSELLQRALAEGRFDKTTRSFLMGLVDAS